VETQVIEQPKQVKRPRSIMAPSVKAAVLVSRANGISKRKIARDLHVSRPTIDVILKESNLDQQIESGRLGCANLIPKSIDVVNFRLEKNDLNAALAILNPLVLRNEQGATGKRMAGDLTLNQTLQVLLRSDQPANEQTITIQSTEEKTK
jgi:hypothetical protein